MVYTQNDTFGASTTAPACSRSHISISIPAHIHAHLKEQTAIGDKPKLARPKPDIIRLEWDLTMDKGL